MMPVQAPPQKKSRTLWYVLGGIAVVLVICCVGGVVAANAGLFALGKAVNSAATQIAQTETAAGATPTTGSNQTGPFTQSSTTGTHITKIQTGTGFDENSGAVKGETDTFHVGDTVHVVFTVTNAGSNTILIVKMYAGSDLEHTSSPESIDSGTNVYDYSYTGPAQTGTYKAEIDYNGTQEGTITFNVT